MAWQVRQQLFLDSVKRLGAVDRFLGKLNIVKILNLECNLHVDIFSLNPMLSFHHTGACIFTSTQHLSLLHQR
jgi:hypothetical protein